MLEKNMNRRLVKAMIFSLMAEELLQGIAGTALRGASAGRTSATPGALPAGNGYLP
jgi:hypothetical protein